MAAATSEVVLLRQGETSNGNASLSLLELPAGARVEFTDADVETSYFLLSGRGTAAFTQRGYESRWVIDPDTSIWVAGNVGHAFVNTGEGPFRCLAARCRSSGAASGGKRVSTRSEWAVHELVGLTSRTILDCEAICSLGATRTIGVDLETIAPRATLATHAHEEEILYVLRGKGHVRTEAAEIPVEPGSAVYTGPWVPHSVENTEDDNLQYLVWEFRP